MFTAYILYSHTYSHTADRYYVGHTADVENRVSRNNAPVQFGEYTRKNGLWILVYEEKEFETRSAAIHREREIKGWKSRKMIKKPIDSLVGSVPTL